MSESGKTALIVGCGYTGSRLARRLADMGFRVIATSRTAKQGLTTRLADIQFIAGDLRDAGVLSALGERSPSVVAYFVAPQQDDDPLAAVLARVRNPALEAFLYASSSSVYGDRAGAWVDETTEIIADNPEDADRHAAERCVAAAARDGIPARICRITGIYGPGRTLRGPLATGQYALIQGHDPWINRIHVDDLVEGFIAAWKKGTAGTSYNMVDERPHLSSEFANLAADLNQLPRPAWISETDARARYDAAELRRKLASKRVRCFRLRDELKVALKYPSFLTGLAAAVAQEE